MTTHAPPPLKDKRHKSRPGGQGKQHDSSPVCGTEFASLSSCRSLYIKVDGRGSSRKHWSSSSMSALESGSHSGLFGRFCLCTPPPAQQSCHADTSAISYCSPLDRALPLQMLCCHFRMWDLSYGSRGATEVSPTAFRPFGRVFLCLPP